ncbi:hypothetical protein NE686_18000 [Tissierella carlieri]|uniref:Uncharacterized protein n=1 Tax=Tissierella carlieri TaxID=689904 RepID=A0ABT1SEU0_9FIRM|nr:hypothetical protein [Tissierella carlieri]MCQ4924999.1 hypothetical protein [Tissierella carlieri]
MHITEEMIEEANKSEIKCSSAFENLSFYKDLMNAIDKEYSNDEIESLVWILSELGRNVEYVITRDRLSKKYEASIELTRDLRRNNIKISIREINYLLLSDGTHKFINSRFAGRNDFKLIPFYRNDLNTIKEIHKEFDILADNFNITNRIDAIKEIEELTKCKRADLDID